MKTLNKKEELASRWPTFFGKPKNRSPFSPTLRIFPEVLHDGLYQAQKMHDMFSGSHNYLSSFLEGGLLQAPPLNISEDENGYFIELIAPKLNKEDIDIKLDGSNLEISYEQEIEGEENTENYLRKEYVSSSFSKSFKLPDNVDTASIKAEYNDGVLDIHIKKAETEKAKNIKVK